MRLHAIRVGVLGVLIICFGPIKSYLLRRGFRGLAIVTGFRQASLVLQTISLPRGGSQTEALELYV